MYFVDKSNDAALLVASLSVREHQVLDGFITGRPNKNIAHDERPHPWTFPDAGMMQRLGVRQLAGASRLGVMALLGSYQAVDLYSTRVRSFLHNGPMHEPAAADFGWSILGATVVPRRGALEMLAVLQRPSVDNLDRARARNFD